jgi:TM2 domain/Protein of unknown function (DUF2510)
VTPESTRPAGWYDDEADAALQRYWDGAKWSPHTAPRATDAAAGVAVVDVMAPIGVIEPPAAFEPSAVFEPSEAIDEATTVRPRQAPPEDAAALFRDVRSPMPPPPARPADEHTTVPLPPGDAATGASGPQYSPEAYRTTDRAFLTTWLFALLLGFWGADRFYLGKTGTAVVKLLTLGGLGVWVLVDLVLVLIGAQRDLEGRRLDGYEEHKRVAWIVTGTLVALGLLSTVVSSLVSLSLR